MTAIIGSYEGSNPWNGNMLYREMMGQEAAGTTLFTGQASWLDYTGSASWAASTTESIGAQKLWSVPLFANSSSLKEAASGADDKYFAQVAKSLLGSQASGSIYVRTGWEFNGGYETWYAGSDPADYIKAYQQFVDAFRSVSNRFVFTWSPGETNGGMDPAAAYPGDAYVDIIGLDVYDNNTYQGNNATAAFNNALEAKYGLNWLANFASQHGKQIAIPEWGVNNNNDAAFVTLMANWIKTHNVAYASYWDADAGNFNGLLSGMPAVEAAYLAAFGSSAATTVASSSATASTTTTPTAPATTTTASATTTATPVATPHKASADLDGDHKSDIVLWNSSTHTVEAIESGTDMSSAKAVNLGSVTAPGWSIVGEGDFDGDGKADLLWTNSVTHDLQLWDSTKGFGAAHAVDLGVLTEGWSVTGVGDFDGDGKTDILWQNSSTGDFQIWESSKGLGAAHSIDLGTVSSGWTVMGTSDFDGDGKSDILWENKTTRDVQVWESSKGFGAAHSVDLGILATGLTIVGTGDLNGDGKAEFATFNATTRDLEIWGTSNVSAGPMKDLGSVSAGWAPVAVGDFDGDGKADILWQNSQTHDLQVWESSVGMNAGHAIDLGVVASGLSIATTHSY